jgi:hypothetical protein
MDRLDYKPSRSARLLVVLACVLLIAALRPDPDAASGADNSASTPSKAPQATTALLR